MKIAIVAPLVSAIREPQGGGSQAFVSDLARGLAGRAHEVHVYAATGSQIPGVTVIDTGVDPGSLLATLYRAAGPAPRDQDAAARAFAGVYSRVRQTRYDVVHNHAFDAPAIALAGSAERSRGPYSAPAARPGHRGRAPRRGQRRAGRRSWPACPHSRRAPGARSPGWTRSCRRTCRRALIPWSSAAGGGAVFAGRLSPEKGAAEAIDIARLAGIADRRVRRRL